MEAEAKGDERHGRLARWWNDLPVSAKGYVVLAVPVVCLLVVASLSLALTTRIGSLQGTSARISGSIDNLGQTLADLNAVEADVRGYAATGDARFLTSYQSDRRPLLAGLVPDPAADNLTPAQAAPVNRAGRKALAVIGSVRTRAASGLGAASADRLLRREATLTARARSELVGVKSTLERTYLSDTAQVGQLRQTVQVVGIAGLAVGVLGGVLAAYLFLAGVVRRVHRVAANAERLGREEPLELEPPSRDAIGVVEAQLETAAERLTKRTAELRDARDAAVAATRAKDEFISRISHELRTPLTSVLGFGELLQYEELSPENRDSVNRIVRAGRHLLTLINDLLDIGRIESGHLRVVAHPVAVAEEADEVIATMHPMAVQRSVTVTSSVGDVLVVADHQRLQQVLLNLVSNAIKYNREGGSVGITAEHRPHAMVRLSVRDTGPGIGPDDLGRLFVPFERLGAERSAVQGTGMGLALCKALVQAMNGMIGVDSEPGVGSTFWVELPGQPSSNGDRGSASHHGRAPVTGGKALRRPGGA